MARKKTKSKRRTTPRFNIVNASQAALLANAITQGMFNTNLVEFFTGNTKGGRPFGADGASVISLPELLGFGSVPFGGNYGNSTLTAELRNNLKKNGLMMAGSLILIPVGFKVGKELTGVVRREANKGLRMIGLKKVMV